MRNLSDGFLNSDERYYARIVRPDGSELTSDDIQSLSVKQNLVGSSSGVTLGSTPAAQLDAKITAGPDLLNERVSVYIGKYVDDVLEEICLGVFTIAKSQVGEDFTDLTGYDALYNEFEFAYYPSGSATTAQAVLREVAEQAGVELSLPSGISNVSVSISTGYTLRETAGYMAALLGCNARMDCDTLVLEWFDDTGQSLNSDDYYAGELTLDTQDWKLGMLECSATTSSTTTDDDGVTSTSSDTETYTSGDGATGISFSNPFMTQSILDNIYSRIGGFTYRGGEISIPGDLRFEPGDVLTVDGRTFPIMAAQYDYDGGLKMSLSAYAESETDAGSASGPVTQALDRLTSEFGIFEDLQAENFRAVYANIHQIEADYIDVTELYAEVANINYVLSGYTSTGTLDAIHLTAENAVVESEVIINAIIDNAIIGDLLAGSINTDIITIYSESGGYVTKGATTQYYDADGNIRIQIGQDESGNFTFVLYSADGEGILIDETGIKASAISDGLIVNDMVSDDAAISGYKLDIASVTDYLNEYGQLVMDASMVTINDQTLDAWYVEVSQTLEGLEGLTSEGLMQITPYFAIGDSDTDPPSLEGLYTASLIGEMEIGNTLLGVEESAVHWTTERLTAGTGEYLWVCYQGLYADGHIEWTTPYCLTDGYLRTETSTLQTEFTVINGQIESKIWMTDIESGLDEYDTVITERFSDVNQTLDGITSTVGEIETGYGEMSARVSTIEQTADSISMSVTAVDEKLDGTTAELKSEIEILSNRIDLVVSGTEGDLEGVLDAVEARISLLADSINMSVTSATKGTASIKLTVNGEDAGEGELVENAREAFENEDTSCTITAGIITFRSGTLVIESSALNLDADGNLTIETNQFQLDSTGNAIFSGELNAPSGKLAGWGIYGNGLVSRSASSGDLVILSPEFLALGCDSYLLTSDGVVEQSGANFLVDKYGTLLVQNHDSGDYLKITSGYLENGSSDESYAKLYSGKLRLAHQGVELGNYGTSQWAEDTSKIGLNINLEYATDYIAFGRKASADATTYTAAYVINYGINSWDINDYTERHIFYGTARITGDLTVGGTFSVNGDFTVGGSVYANRFYPGSSSYYFGEMSDGRLMAGGNLFVNGSLTALTRIYVGSSETAYIGATTSGGLHISADLSTEGNLYVGNVDYGRTLNVAGTAYINGVLTVNSSITTRSVTFGDTYYIRFSSDSSGDGGLETNGRFIIGDTDWTWTDGTKISLSVNGYAYVTGVLGVGDYAWIAGDTTVGGNLSVSGSFSIGGEFSAAIVTASTSCGDVSLDGETYSGTSYVGVRAGTSGEMFLRAHVESGSYSSASCIVGFLSSSSYSSTSLAVLGSMITLAYSISGTSSAEIDVYTTQGEIDFTASTIYSSVSITVDSDARLKDDFGTLEQYDAVFDALEPISYRYIDGSTVKHTGFTYQNARDALKAAGIDPEDSGLINTRESRDGETYGGISYDEIIAMLVYEVQTLKRQMKGEKSC